MNGRSVDALHCPYYPRNPYQDRLFAALEEQGIGIVRHENSGRGFRPMEAWSDAGRPDVVHLHWTPGLCGLGTGGWRGASRGGAFLLDLARLRRRGVRIVWTVHNLWDHKRRSPVLEAIVNVLLARIAHALIVHCRSAVELVVRGYRLGPRSRRKVRAIPHGTFLGCYPDVIDRDAARRSLNLGPDSIVITFLGRIRAYKGVDHLLRSFRRVSDPRLRLIIAGRPSSDADPELLRSLADEDPRVKLVLEFVPDREVQLYLNAADAIVLSYRDVLTSGSAVLAMSFGRAVIAPAVGCVPDLLGDSGGILYDPEDPGGLQKALSNVGDRDLESMGSRNRALARSDAMSWSSVAEKTVHAYGGAS